MRIFTATTRLLLIATLTGAAAGCASQQPAREPSGKTESDPKSASTYASGFGSGLNDFSKNVSQFFQNLSGDTPVKYAKMTMSDSADARRVGINGLVEKDFGKRPPYTDRYADLAALDPDPLVRATAIRALNQSRDKSRTKLFIKSLGDASPLVRLEAAKALRRVPDPDAAEPLLKVLNATDEDKDVRIAAADALQHYKRLDVARSLVALLSNRDFGLAWQSRRSLKSLTGRDLFYDDTAWLQYLTGPDKPFS
jgi:hypothetical protein